MKKASRLIPALLILCGLAYVLWTGLKKHEASMEHDEEAPAAADAGAAEEEPEAFTVMLDKERAELLAIEKEQPQKMELKPRRAAYGSVMDPSALVMLDGDLAGAEAALAASKAEHERNVALAATNDASKKIVEASQAQFQADQLKLQSLSRGAQLQWGPAFEGDAAKRTAFIADLLAGKAALVRVDILPGDALTELPKAAEILVMGREDTAISCTEILPATAADPKTQAQGCLLIVRNPPFILRPGMALQAWLELPEKAVAGFSVPRSAVLRHDGATWVYVQEEAEKYVRKPVRLVSPLDGDQGWFVAGDGGLGADDVVVVTGAASLLSEELKAQGGGGEE